MGGWVEWGCGGAEGGERERRPPIRPDARAMDIGLNTLQVVSFLDPAGKRRAQALKKARARTAIVTIGTDHLGRVFVLDAWADKSSTEAVVERVFTTIATYTPRQFGVEANGLQELFGDLLFQEAKRRGIHAPFHPVFQPTNVDKFWRIRTALTPVVNRGRLFLQKSQHELRVELSNFPSGKTVDLVDALASAVELIPTRPAAKVHSEERDALAAFLRRAGATPDHIEARLARFDRDHGLHAVGVRRVG